MKRIFLLVLALMTFAGLLGGCASRKTVTLGQADNGSTVQLSVGDSLVISLPGNPTTGFNWLVASADGNILQQKGDVAFKTSSSALGAGGTITLSFQAVAAGETPLVLQYKRAWETGTPPEQTFGITIVVK